eukprot:scaffold614_cov378-Pavlova_lutheri.AAC.8
MRFNSCAYTSCIQDSRLSFFTTTEEYNRPVVQQETLPGCWRCSRVWTRLDGFPGGKVLLSNDTSLPWGCLLDVPRWSRCGVQSTFTLLATSGCEVRLLPVRLLKAYF